LWQIFWVIAASYGVLVFLVSSWNFGFTLLRGSPSTGGIFGQSLVTLAVMATSYLGAVTSAICLFVGGMYLKRGSARGIRLIRYGAVLAVVGILMISGLSLRTYHQTFNGLNMGYFMGSRILGALTDLLIPVLLVFLASRHEMRDGLLDPESGGHVGMQ
jgi:hypothetical protein